MASKFQSRLVGTVILVAIGVIVLPDVFDGEKKHYKEEFAAIPIKPTIDTHDVDSETVVLPEELDIVSETTEEESTTTESDSTESSTQTASNTHDTEEDAQSTASSGTQTSGSPRETNDYQDSAWIIQLVALKNQENANKLVADLKKRGFQAYLKVEGDVSRVIVGPDVSKDKLTSQLDELEEITHLRGQIQKFKPISQ